MNAEIKARWVAALRSGEYEQGIGSLHTDSMAGDKWCCLGVLCDLYLKDHKRVWNTRIDDLGSMSIGGGYSGQLPPEVVRWAGVEDSNPSVPNPYGDIEDEPVSLAEVNDSGDSSFHLIARLIETSL